MFIRYSILWLAIIALATASCSGIPDPLAEADPFVGTGFHGHTYPGASAPFGMVQLSPDTRNMTWDGCSGYHQSDSTILGFSHTHISGTGCADLGDFLFLPYIGDVQPASLPFSHKNEKASPGYYRVSFPEYGITAELTATTRVGVHRYTFKGSGERHVLVDAAYNIGGTNPDNIVLETEGEHIIKGGRHVNGWAPDRYIFFSAAFSVPFISAEMLEGNRCLVTFPESVEAITIAVGLSGVDTEGAARNRESETGGMDFDAVKAETAGVWANALGTVRVEGGSKKDVSNFYSALYHTMLSPNRLDDVDGRYRDFALGISKVPEGRAFYSTLSLWDTFRSWNPLQTIINIPLVEDMVFSMLDMYEDTGRIPMWPLGSSDTECMIGYHGVAVIADAWLRGIRSFDGEKALEAMIRTSDTDPCSDAYNDLGYVPANVKKEAVSKTLEFAYDDWCIARMAEDLGHTDIAERYYDRSRRYIGVFDASTGFMRGRSSDGNWLTPFSTIASSRDFTEGIPWQYRFFAPHDVAGLTSLIGGQEAMVAALDSLFYYEERDPGTDIGDMTGFAGQYAHGNEPSHNMTYLYNFVGQPGKSQKEVRRMLDEMYFPTPEGISGNEDCGQMSAWYVLSSLGIYPACPGTGEYVFAAPLFKKATITLSSGNTLIIKADHPDRPYIESVSFNGQPIEAQYITYDEFMAGGELSFKLSKTPSNKRDSFKAPYSLSTGNQVSIPFLEGNPAYYEGSLDVVLKCRNEGAHIHYTLDGSEPDQSSPLYSEPFEISDDVVISARAFKDGMDPSEAMRVHAFPCVKIPAAKISGLRQGSRYTYHKGLFTCTADVLSSRPVSSGVMVTPSIKDAPDEDHFGYVFTGYLNIPEDGLWEFTLRSDDGAVLEIDGKSVVDNDGSHSAYSANGRIPLMKGMHPFRLSYLEDYEGQELSWGWKAPGQARFQKVPDDAIYCK